MVRLIKRCRGPRTGATAEEKSGGWWNESREAL
jgi:hypothetical protein